jgi:hypothetical protein
MVVTQRVQPAKSTRSSARGIAPGVQELAVHGCDAEHGVGVWRNLLIAVWRKETRAGAVDGVSAVLGELAQNHRDVALLQVIEEGALAPDPDARRAISNMLKQHGSVIRCSAVVYEGDGFRAATLRGVVTGIALLSRPLYPHVVFASAISAINWTARHFSQEGPAWAEQVRNAVDELRVTLDRPRASPRFGASFPPPTLGNASR